MESKISVEPFHFFYAFALEPFESDIVDVAVCRHHIHCDGEFHSHLEKQSADTVVALCKNTFHRGQHCVRQHGALILGSEAVDIELHRLFYCKTRNWRDFPERIEYVCNGYHRYGKENCSPHRINEMILDELIYKEILAVKDSAIENYNSIEADVKKWMKQKNNVGNKLQKLNNELEQRKEDQKDILLERIRDKDHSEIYSEMLEACENDIQQIKQEIESIKDYNTTIKKRKSEIKQTVDLIEEIVKDGAISNANLRLLVDEIKIYESDKRLKIEINLKANFTKHFEIYGKSGENHSLILQDLRK